MLAGSSRTGACAWVYMSSCSTQSPPGFRDVRRVMAALYGARALRVRVPCYGMQAVPCVADLHLVDKTHRGPVPFPAAVPDPPSEVADEERREGVRVLE